MPQFDVLIVGAGLVGIASSIALQRKGHKVRVLESTSCLQTVGDAIAVGANQQRVLEHYGILDEFRSRAVRDLGFMYHHRYSDGAIISKRDMATQEADYGYPSFVISRAGYQDFLFEKAKSMDVEFCFGTRIKKLGDKQVRPYVVCENGVRWEADVIVGADGVKSTIRQNLFPDAKLEGQWYCFRATVGSDQTRCDTELAPFLDGIHFTMGPNVLLIQSNMSDIGVLSLNLYHRRPFGTVGSWKTPGDVTQMREVIKTFSHNVQRLLNYVEECVEWKIVELTPLSSWVSGKGKVVLVGDAAHAMTPYQGQGCSTGLEDSGVLAECLDRATYTQDLPDLLRIYQDIRKPRTDLIQRTSTLLGETWSLPDGEQQRQRDDRMRKTPIYSAGTWDGHQIESIPSGLNDPTYSPWLMGHDAIHFARRQLDLILAQGNDMKTNIKDKFSHRQHESQEESK